MVIVGLQICNGIHNESSPSFGSPSKANDDKVEIIEEIVREILNKSEKLLEERVVGTISPVVQDEEIVQAVNEVVNNVDKPGDSEESNSKEKDISVSDVTTSPEKEIPDSDLSERYLTPTEETEKVSEETDNNKDCSGDAVAKTDISEVTNSKEPDKLNVSVSDKQTDNKISEAVPIVENSAVSVELEPSNVDSSLDKSNIPNESSVNTAKSVDDSKTDEGTETSEVPAVENIPTISQICDPSHYTTTSTDVAEPVLNDKQEATGDDSKRRVSLPANHVDGQPSENVKEPATGAQVSPQKRPRSASTSTQVDPNHFGTYSHNKKSLCVSFKKPYIQIVFRCAVIFAH